MFTECRLFYQLIVFLSVLLSSLETIAQNVEPQMSSNTNSDAVVPFYKWELNVDALPLINKSKDSFGYVLKRNFLKESGRQALRVKLLPSFGYSAVNGTVSNSSVYLAVGYEWQTIYNRFAILYGLEPTVRYSNSTISGQVTSSSITDLYIGASGFLGGRYYLSRHLSITLESHLIYNYHKVNGDNVANASKISVREHILFLNPIHAIYIGYHF